jgi:hypothetical protein
MIGSTATAPVRGVGLALLLQQGVAAWLQAISTCISPSPQALAPAPPDTTSDDHHAAVPVSRGPRADVIPWAQHAEVARLLAGLVLSVRSMRRDRPAQDGAYV